MPKNNMTVGSPPLAFSLMKGVYKYSPPTPRYQSTWLVKTVLIHRSSLHPPEKLDLKSLTLVMLIALVSAQRGQCLHMLDIGCVKEVSNRFEFLLMEHVKQSRPGYRAPSVILQAYPSDLSLLCVYLFGKISQANQATRGSGQ